MSYKILIVEDEFIVANDLRLILQQAGYIVVGIADSFEEATDKLKKNRPDLALLDIQLKGKLSGINFASKLKDENIAVVYLSAYSSQKILEEVKTTEPYGFLVKPFRENDLLAALEIALYRHKHSLESKARLETILQKQLEDIGNKSLDTAQSLLSIGRVLQSYIPFDLITTRLRPSDHLQDIGYLRIGYDEYQFIGNKELATITGINESELSKIHTKGHIDTFLAVYNESKSNEKPNVPSIERLLIDTFNLQSYIVFPITLRNGFSVNYYFYSRQRDVYAAQHINLLNSLKVCLSDVTEKIKNPELAITLVVSSPGTGNKLYTASERQPVFNSIIGNHHLLLSALDLAAQVAPFRTSVLILGESGTGKEKVAESIHYLSPWKDGPLVKVNCGAIPKTLIESELFGHEKGAFTGAIEKRKGKFELADNGTIFLDEIGELPLDMQVKLLRVLQEKEIQSVGGNSVLKVNVRIVTATNRNLEKEVAAGNFRLDLYYRLNVFPIVLPPLRERESDIETLAEFFGRKFCKEFNKAFLGIADSMRDEMLNYSWPGNIRELENVLEQTVILNDGKSALQLKRSLTSTAELAFKADIKTLEDVKRVQQETEKNYIISVLKKTQGRIRGAKGAAELLNIKPTTLESKIDKLNINRGDFLAPTD